MCGIAGVFVRQGDRTVDSDVIPRMAGLLSHRGPDGWGYFLDDSRQLLLLHTRLAIVDLATGRQPMSNEDGSIWISVNGEIYGYEELIDDLTARGHVFKTRCDSEVILHLYEEYGESFVERLRGEFAIALFDERRRALYLVRDRFGIKPLYFTQHGDTLLFASEIKALLCYPGVTARLDEHTVVSMMATIVPPSATIFEGIQQVEPGCFLKITEFQSRQVKYWTLPLAPLEPQRNGRCLADEEAVEEFRALLTECIRLRLHGDVEVGAYLSGGIDSSAIACLMARLAPRPVKAFTIGFDAAAYDEAPFARSVARAAGLDHHVLPVGRDGLAPHFAESLWHSELPVMNAHGTAKFLLSKLAGRHVKVVLSGEGADELLFGYPQFKHHELLDRLHVYPDDRTARAGLRAFLAHESVQFGVSRVSKYVDYPRITALFGTYPYPLLRALAFARTRRRMLSRDFRARVRDWDPIDDLAARVDRGELAGLPPLLATQWLLFKTDLPGYILNLLGDRAEMAHSVEGRVPFLDHKLVEFACGLPLPLRLREACNKYLLREAMRGVLPDELRNRRKKQFLSPSPEVLGLAKRDSPFDDYFGDHAVREAGVFDPATLRWCRRLIRILPRGSYVYGICEALLVFSLSLHVIHELFCKSFSSSAERFAHQGFRRDLSRPASVSAGNVVV